MLKVSTDSRMRSRDSSSSRRVPVTAIAVLALFLMGLWWFWHGSERHVGGRKDAASWKALAGALDRVEKAMKKQEEEEEENGEGDEEDGDERRPCVKRLVSKLRNLLNDPSTACATKAAAGNIDGSLEVALNDEEQLLVRTLLKKAESDLSETQWKALEAVRASSPRLYAKLRGDGGATIPIRKTEGRATQPPSTTTKRSSIAVKLPVSSKKDALEGLSGTSDIGGRGYEGWKRDFEFDPRDPKNNAVFISVVTFRDVQCPGTLKGAFERAARPDLVRIGVVQQNEDSDVDCFQEYCKEAGKDCRSKQVRVIRMKSQESRGVMIARGLASTLWSGERWYLQIDAHSGFNTHWDDMLINSTLKTGYERTILTHHPGDMAHFPNGYGDVAITPCMYKWDRGDRLPRGQSMNLDKKQNKITKPVPTIFIGAGTVFGRSQWIVDCPFDPHLPYIFTGEELLLAVCLFTKGWNMYAPDNLPVWHYYTRPAGPRHPSHDGSMVRKATARLKYLFGHMQTKDVPRDYLKNVEPYLMGNIRTRDQFWEYAQLDFANMPVKEPFCEQMDFSNEALVKSKFPLHFETPAGLIPLDDYFFDTVPTVPPKYRSTSAPLSQYKAEMADDGEHLAHVKETIRH